MSTVSTKTSEPSEPSERTGTQQQSGSFQGDIVLSDRDFDDEDETEAIPLENLIDRVVDQLGPLLSTTDEAERAQLLNRRFLCSMLHAVAARPEFNMHQRFVLLETERVAAPEKAAGENEAQHAESSVESWTNTLKTRFSSDTTFSSVGHIYASSEDGDKSISSLTDEGVGEVRWALELPGNFEQVERFVCAVAEAALDRKDCLNSVLRMQAVIESAASQIRRKMVFREKSFDEWLAEALDVACDACDALSYRESQSQFGLARFESRGGNVGTLVQRHAVRIAAVLEARLCEQPENWRSFLQSGDIQTTQSSFATTILNEMEHAALRDLRETVARTLRKAQDIALKRAPAKARIFTLRRVIRATLGERLFALCAKRAGGAGIKQVLGQSRTELQALRDALQLAVSQAEEKAYVRLALLEKEDQNLGCLETAQKDLRLEVLHARQTIRFLDELNAGTDYSADVTQQCGERMDTLVKRLDLAYEEAPPKKNNAKAYAAWRKALTPCFLELFEIWRAVVAERQATFARQQLLSLLMLFQDEYTSKISSDDMENLLQGDSICKNGFEMVPEPVEGIEPLELPEIKLSELLDLWSADAESELPDLARVIPDDESTTKNEAVREALVLYHLQSHGSVVELDGHCPMCFCEKEASVIPGRLASALLLCHGLLYSFCDEESLLRYARDADVWQRKTGDCILRHPECALMLGVYKELPHLGRPGAESGDVPGGERDAVAAVRAPVRHLPQLAPSAVRSVGTETPRHFPRPVYKNYSSDEWELRRRALLAVRLRHCRHSGAQTIESTFRRDASTQDTVPMPLKDGSMPASSTNTKVSKHTNTTSLQRRLVRLPANKVVQSSAIVTDYNVNTR
ncbi:MAG: hypothetical protein MHM6MM_005287 [Cercozoa sp. M6MM]